MELFGWGGGGVTLTICYPNSFITLKITEGGASGTAEEKHMYTILKTTGGDG